MDKKDTRFENISMTGRLCYVFMCIERYLLTLYPDKDWTVVARKMWQWPKDTWSDGWWEYGDVVPGYILKYKNFEDVSFRVPTSPVRSLRRSRHSTRAFLTSEAS